jgi:hypothetical protein
MVSAVKHVLDPYYECLDDHPGPPSIVGNNGGTFQLRHMLSTRILWVRQ